MEWNGIDRLKPVVCYITEGSALYFFVCILWSMVILHLPPLVYWELPPAILKHQSFNFITHYFLTFLSSHKAQCLKFPNLVHYFNDKCEGWFVSSHVVFYFPIWLDPWLHILLMMFNWPNYTVKSNLSVVWFSIPAWQGFL